MTTLFNETPSVDWEQNLQKNLSLYELPELPPLPPHLREGDRWLAASAMQKAIRRGDQNLALMSALALYELHPAQFWSRLSVIALEDVGIGGIGIAGEVLWIAGKKAWRYQNGGDELVISYLVTELAKVRKSRACDELLCIVNKHPAYRKICLEYWPLSHEQLGDIVLDRGKSLPERSIAAWYLYGTHRHKLIQMQYRKGHANALMDALRELGLTDDFLSVIKMGLGKSLGHAMVVGLVQDDFIQHEDWKTVNDTNGHSELLGGWWPCEALDMHTRDGKRSYSLLCANNEQIRSLLFENNIPADRHVEAIGFAVFGVEGTLMNNRLQYKNGDKLTQIAADSYFGDEFFAVKDTLPELIRQNMGELNRAREKVFSMSHEQMSKAMSAT